MGERYFAEESAFHPAASDFVSACVSGLDKLPNEVTARLEDAQMCFGHRLLRAAVVMLGLAYEAMATEVYSVVVGSTKGKRLPEASKVLEQIRNAVGSGNELATRALNAADEIRVARNHAAHDWKLDFNDVGKVETLLILGGRNVSSFWRLRGG